MTQECKWILHHITIKMVGKIMLQKEIFPINVMKIDPQMATEDLNKEEEETRSSAGDGRP